ADGHDTWHNRSSPRRQAKPEPDSRGRLESHQWTNLLQPIKVRRMARKPMALPTGVELRNDTIRIRFSWNGKRCSETLALPPTQAGIAAASRLRDQVVQQIKHGIFDERKYAELFPGSPNAISSVSRGFGQYAQVWLDSRSISEGTRDNY